MRLVLIDHKKIDFLKLFLLKTLYIFDNRLLYFRDAKTFITIVYFQILFSTGLNFKCFKFLLFFQALFTNNLKTLVQLLFYLKKKLVNFQHDVIQI
jgi:hypothetical protein